MTLPLGLRRARHEDGDTILTRASGAWTACMTRKPWRQWLASDSHFVYLLEQDTLEGCLAMTPSEQLVPGRQSVELLVWYIDNGSRDQQWGRKLLVHGISGARRLAGDDLVCWVNEADKVSSAQLLRHGFKSQMQRETFVGQDLRREDGWLLDISGYF